MKTDYGTIRIQLLPNLTDDQKYTIIKQHVENQVFAHNRTHYNQILDQCKCMVLENPDLDIEINWNFREYMYTMSVSYLSV